ncbi:MAG: hypothetical protein WDW38_011076 [Sanguina aurantia]
MPAAALAAANAPVARCLRGTVHAGQLSISPDAPQVGEACQVELRGFWQRRAADVRLDPPLISACAQDALVVCSNRTDPGQLLGCLKEKKPQLRPSCHSTVSMRQMESAEDVSLDAAVGAECAVDRRSLCSDAGWGEGAAEACLLSHAHFSSTADQLQQGSSSAFQTPNDDDASPASLNESCGNALFDLKVQQGEDIRYNHALASACALDKTLFCRDIQPSKGGVVPCLLSHSSEPGFSSSCKSALRADTLMQATDARLDWAFVTHCRRDVRSLCTTVDLEALGASASVSAPGAGNSALECLRHKLDFVRDPRSHMHMRVTKGYSDSLLDGTLMTVCSAAIQETPCQDLSDVLTCLKAESKKVCEEIHSYCSAGQVLDNHVVDCLTDHRNSPLGFGVVCRKGLLQHLSEAVADVRLMAGLKSDCNDDIMGLCRGVEPGEGKVGHTQKPISPQACPIAISTFCRDVQPGNANVISCLQANMLKSDFPARCKAVLIQMSSRADIKYSLNSKLKAACDSDVAVMCADAADEPKTATQRSVLSCMADNSTGLNPQCRTELIVLARQQMTRYRMGMPLTSPCDGDVLARCSADKLTAAFLERGYIQGCLVKHALQLHRPCWALVSTMDDSQYQHASDLEAKHWSAEALKEHVNAMALEVRRDMEPHILNQLSTKVQNTVEEQVGRHHEALKPRIAALLHAMRTISFLMSLALVMGVVAIVVLRKRVGEAVVAGIRSGVTVFKDGRV